MMLHEFARFAQKVATPEGLLSARHALQVLTSFQQFQLQRHRRTQLPLRPQPAVSKPEALDFCSTDPLNCCAAKTHSTCGTVGDSSARNQPVSTMSSSASAVTFGNISAFEQQKEQAAGCARVRTRDWPEQPECLAAAPIIAWRRDHADAARPPRRQRPPASSICRCAAVPWRETSRRRTTSRARTPALFSLRPNDQHLAPPRAQRTRLRDSKMSAAMLPCALLLALAAPGARAALARASVPFEPYRLECPRRFAAASLALHKVRGPGGLRDDTLLVGLCRNLSQLLPSPRDAPAPAQDEACRWTAPRPLPGALAFGDVCAQDKEYVAGLSRRDVAT